MARVHTYSAHAKKSLQNKKVWMLAANGRDRHNLQRNINSKLKKKGLNLFAITGISEREFEKMLDAGIVPYETIAAMESVFGVPTGSLFLETKPAAARGQIERIIDTLKARSQLSGKDLAKKMGLKDYGSIFHSLKRLVKEGKIENKAGKYSLCEPKTRRDFMKELTSFFGSHHGISHWMKLSQDEHFLSKANSVLDILVATLKRKSVPDNIKIEIIDRAIRDMMRIAK